MDVIELDHTLINPYIFLCRYYGEKLQGWGGRNSTSTSTATRRQKQRRTEGPEPPRNSKYPRQGVLTPGPAPETEGHDVHISTVFDRPQEEDPPAPPLRTQEPTTLSYRQNYVTFTKGSEDSD